MTSLLASRFPGQSGGRNNHRVVWPAGAVFLICLGLLLQLGAAEPSAPSPQSRRLPRLFPDYTGIVLPPNIAPLNFRVEEPGTRYRVRFRSTKGQPLELTSRGASIRIAPAAWRNLLSANLGQPLLFEVWARDSRGNWAQFEAVTNFISREPIDRCLVYRLLKPLYNTYVHLGIYQRDLESFEQRPVLENGSFGGDCLNCHTFLNHCPDTFAFHIRSSKKIQPMILVRSNEVSRVDQTMGYMSWHPSGRLIAFTANQLSLFYHTCGETRDVFDAQSNIGIYHVDANTVVVPPALGLRDQNLTWPAWAPDGRYLYFCSVARLPIEKFRQVRYDLMRIPYNIEQDQWGEPEVLLSAQESGLSAAQPKISPDGRQVLFCLSKYGNFPIYQPSSDLYAMDLKTRRWSRLGLNSDRADSWHGWSSNGRWIVFSSKRLDGLFARPFFSYMDDQGQFYKPFLLPQASAEFYDTFNKTFNLPELVQGPINVNETELARGVLNPRKLLCPKGQTRPSESADLPGGNAGDEGHRRFQGTPRPAQ
jgi:WD40-like Beta Propeller Repeat